jgi:hypothetical protein
VARSFELALGSWDKSLHEHPFFATASLRGVCEDLIAFSYLENIESKTRDRAVELHMGSQVHEGMVAQVEFFRKTRPWQSVVVPVKGRYEPEEKELRAMTKNLGWTGRTAWPSVWYMAKACGLEELYRYMYSATSKWVHFSPHVLLRMGWGPTPFSSASVWHFTTKNFAPYYREFNQTYSVYLLLQLLDRAPDFPRSMKTRRAIAALKSQTNGILRWPELVTFEELNSRPPSVFFQLLMRAAYDDDPEKFMRERAQARAADAVSSRGEGEDTV